MTVIAIFNQKGGVAKTTTCHNLSSGLAVMGRSPITIDFDPQSHLTLACGVQIEQGQSNSFNFFEGKKTLAELVLNVDHGLRLIPTSHELSKVEALYGKHKDVGYRLKHGLKDSFGHEDDMPVLVDCCPMLGVLSLNALIASNKVLVPVSADFLSMKGVHRLDTSIRVLEKHLKREIPRKIVVTRFKTQAKLSFQIYETLKKTFGNQVCETVIHENVSIAQAPETAQSIFDSAPKSRGAEDYKKLLDELNSQNFFTLNK